MILYSVPRNSTYRRATLISAQGGSQRPRADAVTGQSLAAVPVSRVRPVGVARAVCTLPAHLLNTYKASTRYALYENA